VQGKSVTNVHEPNDIRWLETWFQRHCDGTWEHDSRVKLESIDNPGWWLHVNLDEKGPDRVLEVIGDPPSEANGYIATGQWMRCEIKAGRFSGAGDPTKLGQIIACFRKYAERRAD
jgi:hypothetical protein